MTSRHPRFHARAAPRRFAAPAALLLTAAACAGRDAAGAGVARTDSAGVQVVVNRPPPTGRSWRVEAAPRIDISSAAGDGGPQVSGVVGAVRLADGGVVVASGGTSTLLRYDADGAPLAGPGWPRLASLDGVGAAGGGGFWAWDGAELRLWSFDARGRVAGSRRFPGERYELFPRLEGVLADGSLLLSSQPGNVFVVSARPRRDTLTLLRYTFAPPRLYTLRSERGPETFTTGSTTSAVRQAAPFGRGTFTAAGGAEWWVGDSERAELRVYDAGGRLRRIVRWPATPAAVRAEDRERVRRDVVRRARGSLDPAAARELAARLPFPDTYPVFAALLVDRAGNAWVRDGDPARASHWAVFARDGRWLAAVELPPGLEPLDAGDDYVLGRWTSPRGTEHVRLHRLRK